MGKLVFCERIAIEGEKSVFSVRQIRIPFAKIQQVQQQPFRFASVRHKGYAVYIRVVLFYSSGVCGAIIIERKIMYLSLALSV